MANKKQPNLEYQLGYNDNFRKLREKEGLTQKQLAGKLNIVHSTISDIEKGKKTPTIEQLQLYHDYFKVSYDYLLGYTNVTDVEMSKMSEFTGLSEKALKNINALHKQTVCPYHVDRPYNTNEAGRLSYILSRIIENSEFIELIQDINNHIDKTIYFDDHSVERRRKEQNYKVYEAERKRLNNKIHEIRENGYEVVDRSAASDLRINRIDWRIHKIIHHTIKQEKEGD